MSRRKAILAGLLLSVIAVTAWIAYDRREPSYLGHPISYWVEPWRHHGTEPAEREAAAYAEMDERAVRWLVRRLEWKPSKLKEGFARFLNRFGDITGDRDYDGGSRMAALLALNRLGPMAKPAIPELEALSHTTVEQNQDQIRATAKGVLVRIRGDSLEPYIEKLKGASGVEWTRLTIILGIQETNASAAVPILVDGLMQTNRVIWAGSTVIALGNIHSHPDLSVPALMQQLGKTNFVPEYQVLNAIGNFGPSASNAWPVLAARVPSTTNFSARQTLLHTLKQIDPERFANTNWP